MTHVNHHSNGQLHEKVVKSMHRIKEIGRNGFGLFFIVAKLFVIYVKV